jgi:small subunit ribosomal protein S17
MEQKAKQRGKRKENIGIVVSNKMDKTVAVEVTRKMRHARYQKVVERTKKYYAHDESDSLAIGQKVRIVETRPLSKLKRWRVVEAM